MTTLSFDITLDPSSELASANIEYFSEISQPLENALSDVIADLKFIPISTKYKSHSVAFNDKEYISDISFILANIVKNKSGVLYPQWQSGSSLTPPNSVLPKMLGKTHEVIFDYTNVSSSQPESPSDLYTSVVCLGSLSLLAYLTSDIKSIVSLIVLSETSFVDLAISCFFLDYREVVASAKSNKIKFEFLFDADVNSLIDRFNSFVTTKYPSLPFGFSIFSDSRAFLPHTFIDSWLKAPEGFAQVVQHLPGYPTDFINMDINTLVNHSNPSTKPLGVLKQTLGSSLHSCFLVSSGPSLDQYLSQLADFVQVNKNAPIFSCGSSLSSLLSAGITPTYLVILERDPEVFPLVQSLLYQYPEIASDITLIAASCVDSRLVCLFDEVYLFERPTSICDYQHPNQFSFITTAGPQVAIAGLEVAIYLGYQDPHLLGFDFSCQDLGYQRSQNALGSDIRELTTPMPGSSGKTVYSSPDLVFTRDLINQILNSFSSPVSRYGSGLIINNTMTCESFPSSDFIVDDFYVDSSPTEVLPPFCSVDIPNLIDSLTSEYSTFSQQIDQLINHPHSWDSDFLSRICPLPPGPNNINSLNIINRFSRIYMLPLLRALHMSHTDFCLNSSKHQKDYLSLLVLLQKSSKEFFIALDMLAHFLRSTSSYSIDPDALSIYFYSRFNCEASESLC